MEQNINEIIEKVEQLTRHYLEKPESYQQDHYAKVMLDNIDQPFLIMGNLEFALIYAVEEGEVRTIGSVDSELLKDQKIFLSNYNIWNKEYRYRGIGYKALMYYLLIARSQGIKSVALKAKERLYKGVDQNVKLYEKVGFEETYENGTRDLTPMAIDIKRWRPSKQLKRYSLTRKDLPDVLKEVLQLSSQCINPIHLEENDLIER